MLAVATVAATARAQSPAAARTVVRAAERAVSDDSADAVRARWSTALARDSNGPAALLGAATLARLDYDFPEAERLLTKLLTRPGAPDEWSVQARLGLFRTAAAQGAGRRADSLLPAALAEAQRAGDRLGEVEALLGLAVSRGAREGLPAGLRLYDSIAPLLPPGDSRQRIELLCRSGLYRGAGGDTTAPATIREGIAMAERLGERRLAGACLDSYAMVEVMQGRSDSVLAILDRARAVLTAAHDYAALARLYSLYSDELRARGRLGDAKVALDSLRVAATRAKHRMRVGYAYSGLGMLALRTGDLAAAARHFERAAALNDSLGSFEGAVIARQNRAEVLAAAGRLDEARRELEANLDEWRTLNHLDQIVTVHQQLARVLLRQARWDDAERNLEAAERVAREHGIEEARSWLAYDRGRLALARGDLDGAERHLRRFLGEIGTDEELARYTARTRLAETYARRGDLDGAERELAGAGEELERWRASLGDDDLRRHAFAATTLGEYDQQGPVARVLAALAGGGRADAAFTLAERRRARALGERLTQAAALRVSDAGGGRGMAAAREVHALPAEAITAALPDSTAIVEYVTGGDGTPTTVFVVTRSGVRAASLPPADSVTRDIERFVAVLEAGENAHALGRRLAASLLDPVLSLLGPDVSRLVVVPDGPLHRLPFDALPLEGGRYMVEAYAIALAPSASIAVALRSGGDGAAAAPRVIAFGDPAFPEGREVASLRGGDGDELRAAFVAAGGLARLPASGAEARGVARYAAGSVVRLRDEASEAFLKGTDLTGFDVIHFATHALVDETSLARTALALAPGEGEDGFLTPADLADLELAADLVVLSACRTAGGVVVAGEGLQGLTAPLLEAGARSIVATQWRVEDRATVGLVDGFYRELAAGRPVGEALRAAKLAALRRGAPPGEWAAFTVVGNPEVRVSLIAPPPDRRMPLVVAGIGTVLALGAVYLARRRSARVSDRGELPSGVAARTHQR